MAKIKKKTANGKSVGPGRPEKPADQRLRELPRLAVPLTADQWAEIDAAVAASGMSRSAWARESLLRAARRSH